MSSSTEPRHPIRVVAQRTGLTPATLRAWERRYHVVEPGRSDGGQRLYSDRDVERLARLHALTEAGRAIGMVAELGDDELKALEAEDRAQRYEPPEPERPVPAALDPSGAEAETLVITAFARVMALDGDGLEALLRRAAITLGVHAFLEEVVTPLLREVGEAWVRDELRPAHEHLCTAVIQAVLAWLHDPVAAGAEGPRLVVATLPGERHGLGAMLVASAAGLEGWHVTQLGVDLPAGEIARAAREVGARAVALSMVSMEAAEAGRVALGELRDALPDGVAVLVGGRAAPRSGLPRGTEPLAGLAGLRAALGRLAG